MKMKELKHGYAPVNGLKMYYEIYGNGQPILLVHGSFGTIESNFEELIPGLSKKFKVIAVELQGHGHTSDMDREFSYKNHASDLAKLLDYLNVDATIAIGYSLGATICLKLAIDHPKKIKKIVCISSVYKLTGWTSKTLSQLRGLTPEALTETPLKSDYDKAAPDATQWLPFVTKMISFEKTDFDLGLNDIKKLSVPILIINGDYDGVQVKHSLELFKAMGGGGTGLMEPTSKARWAIIPGTTHVTLLKQTDQLVRYIIPFIEENQGNMNKKNG